MQKQLIALTLLFPLLVSLFIGKVSAEAPILTPEQRYEQDLDIWVHRLALCESEQNPKAVNEFDGGSPSYGYVQYKLSTFLNYSKKYNVFPELTVDLVHKYATDKEKSVELTKVIIRNNPKDYTNWYNCTVGKSPNKIGLPPVLKDYLQE